MSTLERSALQSSAIQGDFMPASSSASASGTFLTFAWAMPLNSFIQNVSYTDLSTGTASASATLTRTSSQFFASRAFCASPRGLSTFFVSLGLAPPQASVWATAAPLTANMPTARIATTGFNRIRTSDAPYKGAAVVWTAARCCFNPPTRHLIFGCLGRRKVSQSFQRFVFSLGSVSELRGVHESHLLHVIALRRGHHESGRFVTRPAVRTQMDFRLGIVVALRLEVTLELRNATDHRPVPDDRAIEVDVDLDHFRPNRRRRVVGLGHVQLGRVRHDRNR